MAVDITTPKATAPAPPEPERVSGWEFFRWIYRFFYSKTVGLILILAMAAMVLIGTLLQPQASEGVKADPQRYQQFLDQWREDLGPFGALTGLFDGLGLFDVYRSPLFAIVCGLLAASILACTLHRLPLLWKNWRHPRLVVPERAYDAARYRASVPVEDGDVAVMSQVQEVLRKQRYRVLTDPDHPKAVYADRFAWGGMGAAVSHLSFIIIIVAVVISMNGGFSKNIDVPVGGEPVDVGEGTSLSVAATSYDMDYTSPMSGRDYVSHLVVSEDGKQIAEQDVRVNSPLRAGGVSFYQADWYEVVKVTAKASDTAAAAVVEAAGNDGVLFESFEKLRNYSQGSFMGHPDNYDLAIASFPLDGDLSLLVATHPPMSSDPVTVTTPTGDSAVVEEGQALLEVRKGFDLSMGTSGMVLDAKVVDVGKDWTVGDYVFTFDGQQQYPWIQVRQDPGEPLMWVGSILLVIGITVVFACRHRRLWATWDAGSSRIRFASTDKSDTAWARRFSATVEAVAQEVDSAAHHGPPLGGTASSTEGGAADPVDDVSDAVSGTDKDDDQGEASAEADPEGTKEKTDD